MHAEIEPLVSRGALSAEAGEKLSVLEVGSFCKHKSWGAGKVVEWDLLGDFIYLDFAGKPHHGMKLKFAVNALVPVTEDDFSVLKLTKGEELQAMSKEDPVGLIKAVLKSRELSIFLDELETVLQDGVVEKAKYKSWWESTKKKLKSNPLFVVPSKRNLPLQMRDENLSPADAMMEEFRQARDLGDRAKALDMIVKEKGEFAEAGEALQEVVKEADESLLKGGSLNLATALQLARSRDELVAALGDEIEGVEAEAMPQLLEQEKGNLGKVMSALPVALLRSIYPAFPKAFPEDWFELMVGHIDHASQRSITELTAVVEKEGKMKEFHGELEKRLSQRRLNPEVLIWIGKERGGITKPLFDASYVSMVIHTLEKLQMDESRKGGKLFDWLLSEGAVLTELSESIDAEAARSLGRRIQGSPVFDSLNQGSLLARIIKVHPEVQSLMEKQDGGKKKTTGMVVSWESLEKKKKELDEIINVKIPANKKEIQIAREYGDLRENFEYKAAKQMQAVLGKQRADLEKELKGARGTDFADADLTKVSIGTIVTVKEVESGKEEVYTVLGAWDTVVEKGIISYLSEAGQALLGTPLGESAQLPSSTGGQREVVVESVEAFVK